MNDEDFLDFCDLAGISRRCEPHTVELISVFGSADEVPRNDDEDRAQDPENRDKDAEAKKREADKDLDPPNNRFELKLPSVNDQDRNVSRKRRNSEEEGPPIAPFLNLAIFTNLREVNIIQQNLVEMLNPRFLAEKGTTNLLPRLEKLNLNENRLTSLRGISCFRSLRHFYAGHNEVATVDPEELQHLPKLRTLWLMDNQLTHLTGFNKLSGLTDLNVAANRINKLSIAHLPLSLRKFNIAGNKLCEFADLVEFSKFGGKFENVALQDPDFGCNPICTLPYYDMFVLRYVGWQVQILDHLVLGEAKAPNETSGGATSSSSVATPASGTINTASSSTGQNTSTTMGNNSSSGNNTSQQSTQNTRTGRLGNPNNPNLNVSPMKRLQNAKEEDTAPKEDLNTGQTLCLRQADIQYLKKRLFYSMRQHLEASVGDDVRSFAESFFEQWFHDTCYSECFDRKMRMKLEMFRAVMRSLLILFEDLSRRENMLGTLELETVSHCSIELLPQFPEEAFKHGMQLPSPSMPMSLAAANTAVAGPVDRTILHPSGVIEFPAITGSLLLKYSIAQTARIRNRFWQMRFDEEVESLTDVKDHFGWLKNAVFTSNGPIWSADPTMFSESDDETAASKLEKVKTDYLFMSCGDEVALDVLIRQFMNVLDHGYHGDGNTIDVAAAGNGGVSYGGGPVNWFSQSSSRSTHLKAGEMNNSTTNQKDRKGNYCYLTDSLELIVREALAVQPTTEAFSGLTQMVDVLICQVITTPAPQEIDALDGPTSRNLERCFHRERDSTSQQQKRDDVPDDSCYRVVMQANNVGGKRPNSGVDRRIYRVPQNHVVPCYVVTLLLDMDYRGSKVVGVESPSPRISNSAGGSETTSPLKRKKTGAENGSTSFVSTYFDFYLQRTRKFLEKLNSSQAINNSELDNNYSFGDPRFARTGEDVSKNIELKSRGFKLLADLACQLQSRQILYLNLSHNKIKTLFEETSFNFEKLEMLDVSYNCISRFEIGEAVAIHNKNSPEGTAAKIPFPRLQKLNLTCNQIICGSEIDALSKFYGLQLTHLLLEGNPFTRNSMRYSRTLVIKCFPALVQLDLIGVGEDNSSSVNLWAKTAGDLTNTGDLDSPGNDFSSPLKRSPSSRVSGNHSILRSGGVLNFKSPSLQRMPSLSNVWSNGNTPNSLLGSGNRATSGKGGLWNSPDKSNSSSHGELMTDKTTPLPKYDEKTFFVGRALHLNSRCRAALNTVFLLPGLRRAAIETLQWKKELAETNVNALLEMHPALQLSNGNNTVTRQVWKRFVNVLDLSDRKLTTANKKNPEHLFYNTTTNLTQVLADFKNILRLNLSANNLTNLLFLRYGFPMLEEIYFDHNRVTNLSGLESKCQTLVRIRGNNNLVKNITHLFSHTQYEEVADRNGSKGAKQPREYVVVYSRLQYLSFQRNMLESFITCKAGGNVVAAKLLPSLVELYLDIHRPSVYRFYDEYGIQRSGGTNRGAYCPGIGPDQPDVFLKRKVLMYLKNLPRLWVLQLNVFQSKNQIPSSWSSAANLAIEPAGLVKQEKRTPTRSSTENTVAESFLPESLNYTEVLKRRNAVLVDMKPSEADRTRSESETATEQTRKGKGSTSAANSKPPRRKGSATNTGEGTSSASNAVPLGDGTYVADRYLTLYHCKHLKVLNGVPVTPEQQQRAHSMFGNKLTVELVEELLQCELHPNANTVLAQQKVLDLTNHRFRDIDLRFDILFPNLRKLVLDGNPQLQELSFSREEPAKPETKTSVSPQKGAAVSPQKATLTYQYLPSLVKLCLNNCTRFRTNRFDLSGLQNLETLEMTSIGIDNLQFLGNLPLHVKQSLKILRLGQNEIVTFPEYSFKDMHRLQVLDLSSNKIKAVTNYDRCLEGLQYSLREMHLEDNRLSSFGMDNRIRTQGFMVQMYHGNNMNEAEDIDKNSNTSWFRHSKLQVINLAQNRIQDIKDVGRLSELTELQNVSLVNNPFARKSWYRYQLINHLPHVRSIDGAIISEEELERVRNLVQQHMEQNPTTAESFLDQRLLMDEDKTRLVPKPNLTLGANPSLPGSLAASAGRQQLIGPFVSDSTTVSGATSDVQADSMSIESRSSRGSGQKKRSVGEAKISLSDVDTMRKPKEGFTLNVGQNGAVSLGNNVMGTPPLLGPTTLGSNPLGSNTGSSGATTTAGTNSRKKTVINTRRESGFMLQVVGNSNLQRRIPERKKG